MKRWASRPCWAARRQSIDPAKQIVRLADGRDVPYDKLLVATGSRPFVPPMAGLDQVEKKFSFLTLDDAHALAAALTPLSRVLIVGAGLIGTKCAEGIRHLCRSLTIVDMAPRILPAVLDEEAAALVQRRMEAHGIAFRLSDSVARFEKNLAHLQSGAEIPFDVLVLAVGVRPRTELVEAAGGKVERGIATDACQRTSLPNVYAAGDCTRSHDISTGADKILAILPNAYLQGETAGRSMAGEDVPFDKAIPMNAGGFFGLHVVSAGDLNGESDIVRQGGSYKRLVRRDGRLVGFLLVGDVSPRGHLHGAHPRADAALLHRLRTHPGKAAARRLQPGRARAHAGRCASMTCIDATGLSFRQVNEAIAAAKDADVLLEHALGQRYIGAGSAGRRIRIEGVPATRWARTWTARASRSPATRRTPPATP